MRTHVTLAALLLTLAAAVTACGSEGDDRAVDPGPAAGRDDGGRPAEVPAAEGRVRTLHLATVMDTGRPELCLGPVAESYPPQCGGPEIVNWDWAEHGRDMVEQQGDVRWGTFAVTGRWDGTSFEVTETVPGPLYDAAAADPAAPPEPATAYDEDELAAIAGEVGRLPGAQSAYAADGHAFVDVLYDDGSLQAWADDEYGAAVVVVTSLLVDVD